MIADLEGANNIEMHHVPEAINHRAFERKLFGPIRLALRGVDTANGSDLQGRTGRF